MTEPPTNSIPGGIVRLRRRLVHEITQELRNRLSFRLHRAPDSNISYVPAVGHLLVCFQNSLCPGVGREIHKSSELFFARTSFFIKNMEAN